MTAAALTAALLAVGAARGTAPREIHDDYPRAVATARAEGKLLFVDAWAPW